MYLASLLFALLLPDTIYSEFFTSMANMERLVDTERYMLAGLRSHIKAEEERVASLRQFVHRVEEATKFINESDVGKYLGNPVNSYLMLKRFSVDWRNLEKLITNDYSEDFSAVYDEMRPYFPTEEDYEGAMTALFRLQDTYNLPSSRFAKGNLPGVIPAMQQSLDIREIFELGQHAYNQLDYAHSRDWMRTALLDMGRESSILNVDRDIVLDYLAYSEFKSGNIREAYKLTLELATLRPDEERFASNLEFYRQELGADEAPGRRGDTGVLDENAELKRKNIRAGSYSEATGKQNYMSMYEKLCRGEIRKLTRFEQSKMLCWYKTDNPILVLKPQKIERLWWNPELFMLRDIVTETEINLIKANAYPKLNRATIQDPVTGQLRHADYRVSKSAWLEPQDHEFVRKIALRTEAVTNLDMRSAEQLQIANYGIGGHYEPHFDHAREDEDKFSDLGLGNRIATVLFYLTDVEAGGATVFTNGKAAVFPSKGDAVFWFNLLRNGKGNQITRHAACPVLVGQKWVANWWIHEARQEFRRSCLLDPSL